MKTVGVHEGLARRSKALGPKVSLFFPKDQFTNRQELDAGIHKFVLQVRRLVTTSFGNETGEAVAKNLQDDLNKALGRITALKDNLAYFWDFEGGQLAKVPVKISKLAVVSDWFHLKPLVQARESKAEFVLVSATEEQLEIAMALPTKLEQVAIIDLKKSDTPHRLRADSVRRLRSIVRELGMNSKTPVLVTGSAAMVQDTVGALLKLDRSVYAMPRRSLTKANENSLFDAARTVMNRVFAQQQIASLKRLKAARASGRQVLGVDQVATAIAAAKVKELFVASDICVWGRFHPVSATVRRHAEQRNARDGDILGDFIRLAEKNGAVVHVVASDKLPQKQPAAAIVSKKIPARDLLDRVPWMNPRFAGRRAKAIPGR